MINFFRRKDAYKARSLVLGVFTLKNYHFYVASPHSVRCAWKSVSLARSSWPEVRYWKYLIWKNVLAVLDVRGWPVTGPRSQFLAKIRDWKESCFACSWSPTVIWHWQVWIWTFGTIWSAAKISKSFSAQFLV